MAELRRAFMAMVQDPEFVADAGKARLVLSPLSGEDLQAAVAATGQVSGALVARARRVAEATAH